MARQAGQAALAASMAACVSSAAEVGHVDELRTRGRIVDVEAGAAGAPLAADEGVGAQQRRVGEGGEWGGLHVHGGAFFVGRGAVDFSHRRSRVRRPARLESGRFNLIHRQAMSTPSVGLFEAKTHLSELVARAEQGEEVDHHAPQPAGGEDRADRRAAAVRPRRARRRGGAARRAARGRCASATARSPPPRSSSWVREGREERDEQIWRNATGATAVGSGRPPK